MAEVEVSYQDEVIASMDESGTKVLKTNDKVCKDDITVKYERPQGGSAVVESLTVTENGTYNPPTGVDGYAPVTVNVQGGGGEGNAEIHWYMPKVCVGDKQLDIHSDCELASTLDVSKYTLPSEFSNLTSIDKLNLRTILQNLVVGNSMFFTGTKECYQFENGVASITRAISELGFEDITQPPTTYPATRDTKSRMTVVRNNVKEDSGTDTISLQSPFLKVGIGASNISSVTLNGDSYIVAGNLRININQRDAAIIYSYYEHGTCHGEAFTKVRWGGASVYSGNYDQDWEVVFFANGDVIINIIRLGSTSSGVYNFYGISFPKVTGTQISCYRKDYYGTTWEVVQANYDINHRYIDSSTPYQSKMFSEISNVTYGTLYSFLLNNVKHDDDAITLNFDSSFRWHGLSYATISGNSWIGIGGTNENIKMHRRDSAVYYIYVAYWNITDMQNLHALQMTWRGSSAYSGSIDRIWSLWLFENGDAMIYISARGGNTGTCDFYGQTYTGNNSSYISFYYNPSTSSYNIQYEAYTLEHHIT